MAKALAGTRNGLVWDWLGHHGAHRVSVSATPKGDGVSDVPARPVIVLEDDPLIAAFISKAMRKAGHEVECFDSGLAVLDRLNTGPAGVLLLDLGLPDIDGLEVLRRLRLAGSRLPVVVVTSRSDSGDRDTALSLGVTGYVVKPFPLGELISAVNAIMGDADSGRPE
jgi:DNA-binding response OmpR family regulator